MFRKFIFSLLQGFSLSVTIVSAIFISLIINNTDLFFIENFLIKKILIGIFFLFTICRFGGLPR